MAANALLASDLAFARVSARAASFRARSARSRRLSFGRENKKTRRGDHHAIAAVAVVARQPGPSFAPSSKAKPDGRRVALVAKQLDAAVVGDLLEVVLTPGDGGGRLASGEDAEIGVEYLTVTTIGTSSGGRRLVEGEIRGLRVQVIQQSGSQGGARLGVVGLAVPASAGWLRGPLEAWKDHLPNQREIERSLLTQVVGVRHVCTLDRLTKAVRRNPDMWCRGADAASRRAVITDPVESATRQAGELVALLEGERDVALCQLNAGWLSAHEQPAGAPYVSQLIKRCVESREIASMISESDDVEWNPGLSVVFYNKNGSAKAVARAEAEANAAAGGGDAKDEAGGGDAKDEAGGGGGGGALLGLAFAKMTGAPAGKGSGKAKGKKGAGGLTPGEANQLAAKKISELGAQADCPAVTPYERVLVGLALGYDERDVAYHLSRIGSPFSAALFIRAREVLSGLK